MLDVNAFNFDAMKAEIGNPFEDTTRKYNTDDRFYKLSKDKSGNGAALIRFLPDSEKGMIQQLYKINTTISKNGKKRFVSEYSASTIGQPCPFQEEWQKLWNAGDKDGAKKFGRGTKYVANIKVLKDPANPENEGKIFLYEMSGAIKDKIKNAIDPSEQDRALGAQPKELFNPLAGNSFRLVAKKGANGQINYDSSEVINEVTSIYNSVEEAWQDIVENTYKLSDLLKPESFMPYEKMQEKLKWVTFSDIEQVQVPLTAEVAEPTQVQTEVQPAQPVAQPVQPAAETVQVAQPAQPVQPVQPVAEPTPAQPAQATQATQADSLDALLNGLV